MIKTFSTPSKYVQSFLWLLGLYALIVLALAGTGEEKFAELHLAIDTGNAILSLLLAVFLLGEQHAIQPNVRSYLVIGFSLAAATELLHALIGIEWSGAFAWIAAYSGTLRPATWPPSTYLLPFILAWILWLKRRGSTLKPGVFAAGAVVLTACLYGLSFILPRYVDTGILGIQRPTQVPLLLLWVGVIVACWRERHTHPLYEGLALMGVLLFLSDLCMLYSTSPHEKFTMMAHAGKMVAYTLMHIIQMHIAAEDGRGRSAAESALRENEASTRAILDNSPYLAWMKNPEGQYVRINKVYADYVQLQDTRRVIGKTDFDLWPKELAEKYRADDAEVMTSRQKKHVEEKSLDGERIHWVETFKTPVIDENGNVLGTTGFARDITERKRADAELRIAATVFESRDGMLVTDAQRVILRVNRAFTEITGYSQEEVLGKNPNILSSGRHDKAFYAAMWRELQNNGSWAGEIWDKRKNGQIFPEWLTITAVKSASGETTEYVATFSDITERKQAEDELHRYNAELAAINIELKEAQSHLLQSEKMASIGQLAAGVAHEINNPIGYVYSNLGTLEKYVQDTFGMLDLYEQAERAIADSEIRAQLKAGRDKLDIVFLKDDLRALMAESRDGITRVRKIVQNLKDFSHVDTNDEWHYSDLHTGIDSTLNIVNNEIKYKADVVKEYGDIPDVECLSSQLNQVFMNLLVNASHAIEERGLITVRSGHAGDEVWVEIADTGKGIAPEHMKKIFDPFFTTKPIGKGTGLGLSLSYGILQKHHGRIEVHSELGKGTTFRVWLPVRQPAEIIIQAGAKSE